MAKTDVSEMVNLCKGLGLRVAFEGAGGHYTVRDPTTEAKLFYISSTPSDSNFKYEIARHLRRLGLLKGNLKFGKFKAATRRKHIGAIDLVALKKAQDQAASSGERIPLLEDIEGNHDFFQKIKTKTNAGKNYLDHGYTHEALQEAIDNMAMKLSPRGSATKQRLRKVLDERDMKNSDFVRLSMEVAAQRDLRGFKSMNAGQSAIGKFRNDDDTTVQIWTMNLIEATLDHIEGLKWGKIDESLKNGNETTEPPQVEDTEPVNGYYVTEETLGNLIENLKVQMENLFNEKLEGIQENILRKIQEDVFEGAPSATSDLRSRYAEKLLQFSVEDVDEKILTRLDKLVGLE